MKIKIKKVIEIYNALLICSKTEKLDGKVSYAIARNINRLKKEVEQYTEDNEARHNAFAKKGPDGKLLTRGGEIVFGENYATAQEKYKELINREIEFEPYTIEKSDDTDILPPDGQAELLDIIILEKK